MAGLKVYQAGEILFREGDPGESVFFIMSGKIQVIKNISGQESEILASLGEGDIVGEMAVLDGRPRSATVQASENTEVLEVHKDNFLSSMEQQPKLAINFLKLLALRIEQMNERFRDALATHSS